MYVHHHLSEGVGTAMGEKGGFYRHLLPTPSDADAHVVNEPGPT